MQCVVNGEKNMIYIRFPLSLFTSKQLSWLQPWKKICWWLQWSLDSSLILFDVKKMMTFNSKHSLLSPSNQIMLLSTKKHYSERNDNNSHCILFWQKYKMFQDKGAKREERERMCVLFVFWTVPHLTTPKQCVLLLCCPYTQQNTIQEEKNLGKP